MSVCVCVCSSVCVSVCPRSLMLNRSQTERCFVPHLAIPAPLLRRTPGALIAQRPPSFSGGHTKSSGEIIKVHDRLRSVPICIFRPLITPPPSSLDLLPALRLPLSVQGAKAVQVRASNKGLSHVFLGAKAVKVKAACALPWAFSFSSRFHTSARFRARLERFGHLKVRIWVMYEQRAIHHAEVLCRIDW